ncbi:hypothetical protein ACFXPI_25260 [Streptomyces sp. NPDC059104]|uniref:hypothetical protein n=1 Tax=Streptomyces sp. NPDC059104 TaxID=3346729 RepID=UPI00368445C0
MNFVSRDSVNRSTIEDIIRTGLGTDATGRFLSPISPSAGFATRAAPSGAGIVIGGLPQSTEPFAWI